MTAPIILASQSPRRKQLLEWAEIPFTVHVSETDESYPEGLSNEDTAIHIARNKALAIAAIKGHDTPILAADTIVVCDDEVIGKPADRAHALEILRKLAGNAHEVITGVVITWRGVEHSFADTTRVHFHPLTEEQLAFYVDHYKPYDKAGAYAIQEWIGVTGIARIEGDFYNVMGLPVSRVVQLLDKMRK
jgi:septum formation protein